MHHLLHMKSIYIVGWFLFKKERTLNNFKDMIHFDESCLSGTVVPLSLLLIQMKYPWLISLHITLPAFHGYYTTF